jgi:membrane protease YdiL (CAAX protease family)
MADLRSPMADLRSVRRGNVTDDQQKTTEDAPPLEVAIGPPAGPTAIARLAALFEVLACSGFPTQLAIGAVLAIAGVTPFDGNRLSRTYVFAVSVADALVLVGLAAWFLHLHGEPPLRVFLGTRPRLREALLGLLQIPIVFLLVVAVMGLLQTVAPWTHNVARNPMEDLVGSRLDAVLFVLVAVVGGGIREEVQRAFILHRFDAYLGGGWLGLLLFSVVFASGHVVQGYDVAVTTGVLGFFWGAVYLRRRSIASTVVSHSGFNAAEIFRFVVFGV